ncbi:hypothetical protein DFS33DRAFT_1394625 [Desarmillaria ectypa]|nr:hypothetical protein DFS33DRAFT_1394625 [Desarmillaria ectypa]
MSEQSCFEWDKSSSPLPINTATNKPAISEPLCTEDVDLSLIPRSEFRNGRVLFAPETWYLALLESRIKLFPSSKRRRLCVSQISVPSWPHDKVVYRTLLFPKHGGSDFTKARSPRKSKINLIQEYEHLIEEAIRESEGIPPPRKRRQLSIESKESLSPKKKLQRDKVRVVGRQVHPRSPNAGGRATVTEDSQNYFTPDKDIVTDSEDISVNLHPSMSCPKRRHIFDSDAYRYVSTPSNDVRKGLGASKKPDPSVMERTRRFLPNTISRLISAMIHTSKTIITAIHIPEFLRHPLPAPDNGSALFPYSAPTSDEEESLLDSFPDLSFFEVWGLLEPKYHRHYLCWRTNLAEIHLASTVFHCPRDQLLNDELDLSDAGENRLSRRRKDKQFLQSLLHFLKARPPVHDIQQELP